jgi:uncharacterized membrane protein
MMFLVLKTLHILSATLLFGTGLGTAFHMWMTHLRGDVRAIATTARNVVLADWLFTTTSGIAQPVTGVALVVMTGYDPTESWLLVTYGLYLLAGACWLHVVALQIRVARIAERCVADGTPLPPEYLRAMHIWFWLGWPAFIALVGAYWLMVAKPELW